jgi:hypothetical protein
VDVAGSGLCPGAGVDIVLVEASVSGITQLVSKVDDVNREGGGKVTLRKKLRKYLMRIGRG